MRLRLLEPATPVRLLYVLLVAAVPGAAAACSAFGGAQADTELSGQDLANGAVGIASEADVSACCTACLSREACDGFVLFGTTCYLKQGPFTTSSSAGRVAYLRLTPPSPPTPPPAPLPPNPRSCFDQLAWNEYELVDDFSGTSFFDGWTFTTTDANFGAAHYLDAASAWNACCAPARLHLSGWHSRDRRRNAARISDGGVARSGRSSTAK